MLCALVAGLIQDGIKSCGPGGGGGEVVYWRPFRSHETMNRRVAQEGAYEEYFVLPVFIIKPKGVLLILFLELTLQYSERRLGHVEVWGICLIDTAPIKKWLAKCTSQKDDHKVSLLSSGMSDDRLNMTAR